MKEATGELNATLVVIVAVGVLAAFFFTIIWPRMRENNIRNTKCNDSICPNVKDHAPEDGLVICKYKDKYGSHNVTCPYKG